MKGFLQLFMALLRVHAGLYCNRSKVKAIKCVGPLAAACPAVEVSAH